MNYIDVRNADYEMFHDLLNEYYRDGEDAQTPQTEIDAFIQHLYELCRDGRIFGCVAYDKDPVGFVLWNVDSDGGAFSQKPGFGTILEIGICQDNRQRGIGQLLVNFAESQMGVDRFYVCAYGPAERFWAKCGYFFAGETAENGLKIMVKGDACGR